MEKLKNGIYRICIPFENIYTSSFVLVENNDAIILDSGNCTSDAEEYIVPDVLKMDVNVKYLVSSHTHQDHHGGIGALKNAFPNAKAVMFEDNTLTDGQVLLRRFKILNLKGHTDDSLGVFDIKTKTLLSCDSLQLYGVGRYGTSVMDFSEYYKTIEYARITNPDLIIASHEYVPSGCCSDEQGALKYLDICKKAADELVDFALDNKDIPGEKLAEMYNNKNQILPPVNCLTIKKAIEYIKQEQL